MNGNGQPNQVHEECKMQCFWGKLWEKCKQFEIHIQQGEGPGGHRDRLAKIEVLVDGIITSQKQFKIDIFWACIVASFIGGLVGKVVPWAGDAIGKLLIH